MNRIRTVGSFDELANTPFGHGVNALCWPRALSGNFAEVVATLGAGEGILVLDEARLERLPVSAAGREAIQCMLGDLRQLRALEREPVLNCIYGYPSDENPGAIPTDVFSFHADSAPIEADTWLCTYHGAPSEGLVNEQAVRRAAIPEVREALLREFGGGEGERFEQFLNEHCYDLHYEPTAGAAPYSFGVGNLWRICVEYPDAPVPPCIHRAPATVASQPRLLLIS